MLHAFILSSLRWFCVEIEELIPPARVKMVSSARRMTPVISTPIMFFTFIWEKKVSLACIAAESPADSIAFKARIRSQGQLY